MIFDLGLSRAPGYYTGAVFEVYDPALGMPLGGGGRYDNLLGEFGHSLPAVGFAIGVDRLHIALAAEERLSERRASGHRDTARRIVRRDARWLDGLGVRTDEVRANDHKLLFSDVGLITMRPSDVPTYVAAGAADLGITGKDVLMEQTDAAISSGGRDVYELRDLGYGRCRMVMATLDGPDPRQRGVAAPRVIRVATKCRASPRALRWHRPPGGDHRGQGLQVELAPLTASFEAIVDLTATGRRSRTASWSTRRLPSQRAQLIAGTPRAQLKAAARSDDLLERARCAMSACRAARLVPRIRGLCPGPDISAAVAEIIGAIAERGDEAVRE